jgi:hypothetical protein
VIRRYRPTWRRYARRRVKLPPTPAELALFALCMLLGEQGDDTIPNGAKPLQRAAKPRGAILGWPRKAEDGHTPLGIDVEAKARDIRRLVQAGYGRQAAIAGIDIEDLVQATFEAILRRNRMASAYDPRRGGMPNYVHWIGRCQLSNLITASRRHPVVLEPVDYPILLQLPEMLFALGSYNAVAKVLNDRRVPDPGGTQNWASQTVRCTLINPLYRGKVVRGRRTCVEQAGSIKRIPSAPEDIRVYDRPDLKVWDDETIAKLDAQIQARARNQTWSMGVRRHLASSFLRCPCGGSITTSSSTRSRGRFYCCDWVRSKRCTAGIGYRLEEAVDAAVIEACTALLSDEVITRTREIITAALDVRAQHDTRLLERDRLTRDIATTEKRARGFEEMAADSEGAERERHRAALREQLARLAALQEQLRQLDAQEGTPRSSDAPGGLRGPRTGPP